MRGLIDSQVFAEKEDVMLEGAKQRQNEPGLQRVNPPPSVLRFKITGLVPPVT